MTVYEVLTTPCPIFTSFSFTWSNVEWMCRKLWNPTHLVIPFSAYRWRQQPAMKMTAPTTAITEPHKILRFISMERA